MIIVISFDVLALILISRSIPIRPSPFRILVNVGSTISFVKPTEPSNQIFFKKA